MQKADDDHRVVSLADDQLELLAELVAANLLTEIPRREGLVDVASVAEYLGVDAAWVYAHADDLGARRLGAGAKPRLRFSLPEVEKRLTSAVDRKVPTPLTPKQRLRRRKSGVDLLPVRGSGAAA